MKFIKTHYKQLSIVACIIACLSLCVYFIVSTINTYNEYTQAKEEYETISSYATSVAKAPVRKQESVTYKASETTFTAPSLEMQNVDEHGIVLPKLSIDFKALLNANPDCVGWLYIPSLDISYPVVQSHDNIEYVKTTFNGNENMSGSIFTDCRIAAPFVQKTIVYGHNMKNGTMFHKLFEIEKDPELHKDIWIYVPSGVIYHYEVQETLRCEMTDRDVYSVSATYDDTMILSTCVKNENRFVVVAKRDYVYN